MSFLNRRITADTLGSDLTIDAPGGPYQGGVSATELVTRFLKYELPDIILNAPPESTVTVTRVNPPRNGVVMSGSSYFKNLVTSSVALTPP